MITHLNAAITAHVVWVGRWLHGNAGRLDPARHGRIDALHKAFHAEAARVAALLSSEPVRKVAEIKKARRDPHVPDHINMLGRYSFSIPESVSRGELRPLRNPSDPGP